MMILGILKDILARRLRSSIELQPALQPLLGRMVACIGGHPFLRA